MNNAAPDAPLAAAQVHIQLKTASFRFLWFKYVSGFDPRHHCAPCLKGRFSEVINFSTSRGRGPYSISFTADEQDAPYLYLCGVTSRYEDNLHLPVSPSLGRHFLYEDDRILAHFENAEFAPIRPPSLPAFLPESFSRCRNFQFGVTYFPEAFSLWLHEQQRNPILKQQNHLPLGSVPFNAILPATIL